MRKKLLRRPLRLLRHIHLAGLQARQQFVGRDVDQHHFIGGVEHLVGHGFPDAHVGDAADDVVEALQMLHIQRGEDIDARGQQFIDILPALRMARALHVGMRQFVDQDQRRDGAQRRIQIEFAAALCRGTP